MQIASIRPPAIEPDIALALKKARANVLREAANDLSWLGAQGNMVEPDRAWAGVSACMEALEAKADRLERGELV